MDQDIIRYHIPPKARFRELCESSLDVINWEAGEKGITGVGGDGDPIGEEMKEEGTGFGELPGVDECSE